MVQNMINTVHCMDCLDFMKSMPDKCVDLVLTDPPYGIGESKKVQSRPESVKQKNGNILYVKRKHEVKEWDNKIPDKIYFEEMKRVSKNQIIFGGNYFINYLQNTSCFLVWDKCNGNSDFADCELAWTSFHSAVRMIKYMWCGFCQGEKIGSDRQKGNKKENEQRFHPTQKPIPLFSWILLNYSKSGMTIFDPFAGSGTTAIACLETGRNYILVEKEPEYVKIINKRIEVWKEQGRLFPAHVV